MVNLERVVPLRTGSNCSSDHAEAPEADGEVWLSLDEARQKLGIPLSSLRRYLDRHGRYVPWTRSGKKVLVARSALPVLERIRRMYDSGRSAAAVEDELGTAALLVAGGALAEYTADGGGTPRPPNRPPPASPRIEDVLHPANGASVTRSPVPAVAPGSSPAEMQRQLSVLERRLTDLQASIEARDLMIRQILSAIVQVIEAHDNERRFSESERQIAEEERDRQSAFRHQQVMLSLQEILSFTRRRRWLW